MSEGGLFSWKLQKSKVPPTANYANMTLPPPPPGQMWQQDKLTKEYKLVNKKVTNASGKPPQAPLSQLQPQQTRIVVDMAAADTNQYSNRPKISVEEGSSTAGGDEWDLLSDKTRGSASHNSQAAAAPVLVPKAGSVRSINTLDAEADSHQGSGSGRQPLHPSFKIQRTHSNSTIDSNGDDFVGPAGKGVLGVDYVEHVILPTDTLQGICLAYKISTTRLRQANHFSGHSLLLAPKKLVIPISKKALQSGFIRVQDTDAKEYKLYSFLAEFESKSGMGNSSSSGAAARAAGFGMTEAKAYLELADWDLKSALQSAREDIEWEREMDGSAAAGGATPLKSGEIRLTATANGVPKLQGAGFSLFRQQQQQQRSSTTVATAVSQDEDEDDKPPNATKPVIYTAVPALATKSVQPQDVYQASQNQHDSYGVELKPLVGSTNQRQ